MPKDWWKTFFNQDYLNFWAAKGMFKHTKKEVNFLEKIVPLRKLYAILDLCCGHGRHSIEMASRGYRVTGVDYSSYELGLAKEEARKLDLKIKFIRGDARNLKLNKKFDVILNLFSSAIGYGPDEDAIKILNNVASLLNSGGYFVFDILSATYLLRNYRPRATIKAGKMTARAYRHFDPYTFINYEKLRVTNGGKSKIYNTKLRVFTYPEMKKLLKEVGLHPLKVFGSLTGRAYNLDSKRMVILAKKI